MVAGIDRLRDTYGVESICAQLPIAPSTYWRYKAQQKDPTRRSARAQRDEMLKIEILRVWRDHEEVYGAEKVWRQLRREGIAVARCTVERLMKALGLTGAVRGRRFVVTTRPDTDVDRAPDLVARTFTATRPNQLWVSDFTYVATADGFVYVAFVIDVFARWIAGWKVSHAMRTDLVLDALDQAIHQRCDVDTGDLIHHSDRGVQYLSMRYTERLADAGIEPSVGSRGDSYDNALAESVIGLYKTEVISRRDRWTGLETVEFATLRWVDFFNHRRLLGPIGFVPPAEYEKRYYEQAAVA
jgi:transposase InsO family protein